MLNLPGQGIYLCEHRDYGGEKNLVQRGGRKKDFWDLHELLFTHYIDELINLHRQRFEWTHDEVLIFENFRMFSEADIEPDPICLKGKYWEFIKDDIESAVLRRLRL